MTKTRVAVLRGGPSSEHDISMQTGLGVLTALNELDFFTKDIIISKKGEWLSHGFVRSPYQVLADIDVVIIALHGVYGEDGGVQRLLEKIKVPYTGSGPMSSSVAMNKTLTKNTLKNFGFKLPKHMRLTQTGVANVHRTAQSISELFGPQYIIKPENGGSSIGTLFVENGADLAKAIAQALAEHEAILVEERIIGKEATVGVLEKFRGDTLYVLPPIEIVPPQGSTFFSADVKYTGATDEICPGRFSQNEKKELTRLAQLAHQHLQLSHYSRSDFIVNEDGIYFLEVNTLPGLTEQSLFPKSITAVGSTYNELISHLITMALDTKR